MKCQKNILKYGERSTIASKKDFTVNMYTIKTKKKSNQGNFITNFYNDKIPKEGSQCIFVSVRLINSVFRTGKDYYPQVFFEEYK